MTFVLKIELGNDAMQTGGDVGRAVSLVGHRLITKCGGQMIDGDFGYVLDENGNKVGKWEIE